MKVFDISAIGAVNALAGTCYMVLAGRRLLPAPVHTAVAHSTTASSTGGMAAAPRGAWRLWVTLGLIGTLMTLAAQEPRALLPMALGVLCILMLRMQCGHLFWCRFGRILLNNSNIPTISTTLAMWPATAFCMFHNKNILNLNYACTHCILIPMAPLF